MVNPLKKEGNCPPFIEAEISRCVHQNDAGNSHLFFHLVNDPEGREFRLQVPVEFKETALVTQMLLLRSPDRKVRANFLRMDYDGNDFFVPNLHSGPTNQIPLIVLEPHWLINVTTLTNFDFCQRNYFLERYLLKRQNSAMMRGTFVHEVFEHIVQCANDAPALLRACSAALTDHAIDLAFLGVSPSELYDDAKNHLNGLFRGLKHQDVIDMNRIEEIYPERYIINPHIGLKGRIDLIVGRGDGRKQAIELKTSKPWGRDAQPGHTLQVHAYHLLMMEKREERLAPPMVIYSGEAAKKLSNGDRIPHGFWNYLFREVPFNKLDAVKMMNKRNLIVAADNLMHLEFAKNPNKCRGCAGVGKGVHCSFLHDLGLHGGGKIPAALNAPPGEPVWAPDEAAIAWFTQYNQALAAEYAAVKEEPGRYFSLPKEDRLETGFCLELRKTGEIDENGVLRLESLGRNESEFREGDPCLLSNEFGPVQGECLEVHITSVNNQEISVRVPKGVHQLWFAPCFLDRHAGETHFEKNFASLYTLLNKKSATHDNLQFLRDFLIYGKKTVIPNTRTDSGLLSEKSVFPLHPAQEAAVQYACGLKKLLLIQGPPGTGKTCTVAHIIQALHKQGKRILVGTFTHRASDELMKKLKEFAPGASFTKLGRIESITENLRTFALVGRLAGESNESEESDFGKDGVSLQAEVQYRKACELTRENTVFIATTQAWMSGRYDALASQKGDADLFDVAVIDEASQVILPQMIGTLRLARKWILVGDHQQLPPVVQSEKAALLRKTLFEQLFNDLPEDPSVKIRLQEQHRMPAVLAAFISRQFYEGRLLTKQDDRKMPVALEDQFRTVLDDKKRIILLHVPFTHTGNRYYRQSPSEAEWICKMIGVYDRAGFDFRGNGTSRIGVIAPFRAQVSALRRKLEQAFGDPALARQMADTVDRFQGDERDVIFLSTCLYPQEEPPLLYRDTRRINVALSRAKAKLVVVGDMNLLQKIEVFKHLMDYVQDHPEQCGFAHTGPGQHPPLPYHGTFASPGACPH